MKGPKKQKGFITINDPVVVPVTAPIPGYPFVTCGFAIGNGSHRRTTEPWKTNFASKNFTVHQMLVFSNEAGREGNYVAFEGMQVINPNCVFIPHIDHHGVDFDPPSHASSGWFGDEYVHSWVAANGAASFNNIIATGLLNRGEYTGGPYTSMQSFDHELSYRWDTTQDIHEYMVEGYFLSWSNNYDTRTRAEGGVNLARDFKFGIMQDTLSQNAANVIQWFPEFEGSLDNILGSNEFRILPTWSYPTHVSSWQDHFDSGATPDGDGYYPPLHDVQVVIVSSNRQNSSSDDATGFNPTTGRIRLEGSPNYTYGNGDAVFIKVRQFNASPTDKTSSQWDRDGYHQGALWFLEGYNDIQEAEHGFRAGIYSNQVSLNTLRKQIASQADRESMPVALWQGKWDGLHWEWMDESTGFTSDAGNVGYWVQSSLHGRSSNNYNIDNLVRGAAANTPLLKSNADSANGYPCIWANQARVRRQGSSAQDPTRYTLLNELDAAFVRFYSLLCWCCENLAPQPEMGNHADPVMIDEELIEAGDPITPRNFWENYDPLGDAGRGTWDWKTPDFGTGGYFFQFENCMIQINLKTPNNTTIAWIPSWQPGGQTIDVVNDRGYLPYAGDGWKWQAFDRANYVNTSTDVTHTYYQKTPSDYDATYILKDVVLNDGSDRGAYFDTGALECAVHMRVPVQAAGFPRINIHHIGGRTESTQWTDPAWHSKLAVANQIQLNFSPSDAANIVQIIGDIKAINPNIRISQYLNWNGFLLSNATQLARRDYVVANFVTPADGGSATDGMSRQPDGTVISNWPGKEDINPTDFPNTHLGQLPVEYVANEVYNDFFTGTLATAFDEVYFDHWRWYGAYPDRQADWNRDDTKYKDYYGGTGAQDYENFDPTDTNNAAIIRAKEAISNVVQTNSQADRGYTMQLLGNIGSWGDWFDGGQAQNDVIMSVPSEMNAITHGGMLENWGKQHGFEPDGTARAGGFERAYKTAQRLTSWIGQSAATKTNRLWTHVEFNATEYELAAYTLGAATLAGAYFGWARGEDHKDPGELDEYFGQTASTLTTAQKIASLNWMGQPIGAHPTFGAAFSVGIRGGIVEKGVYAMEFDNGLVLVNPSGNGTQSNVSLPAGNWNHITGDQRAVNTGATGITSVTIQDAQALFFVRN
jgi:hypothetical protein